MQQKRKKIKPKPEKKGAIKHPGVPGFKPETPKAKPSNDNDNQQEGDKDAKLAK